MSSGFLLSSALNEALRTPYHKGDVNAATLYLLEKIAVGEVRVLLKKNFDTACWVPPVGSRGAHSIYYGDRMLGRVIEFFAKQNSLELPTSIPATDPLEAIKAMLGAGDKTKLLEHQLYWLKSNCTAAQWSSLLKMLIQAVGAYGRHEREHALRTPRDLKQVNKDLAAIKVPFQIFNLFEDSRIEHFSREDLGSDFDWIEFEELAPIDHPVNLYLRCIQLEGAPDEEALADNTPHPKVEGLMVAQVAEKVKGFYERAVVCPTAQELYPIMQDFLKEFADAMKSPPPPENGEGSPESGDASEGQEGESGESKCEGKSGKSKSSKGEKPDEDIANSDGAGAGAEAKDSSSGVEERAGDLSTAAEAQDKGDEFFEEFEADAEVVGGTDDEGKKAEAKAKAKLKSKIPGEKVPPPKSGATGQGIPESIEPCASNGRGLPENFLAKYPGTLDATYQKRLEGLTQKLMRLFKTHTLPQAIERPGRRMSSKHLARGELKFVHPLTYGGKGKRKYSVVYDCSGSMSGKPDREGKLFLLALNNLAKRGLVEGSLILSGYVHGASWLQYKFPVKDELILRITPHHAAEGLQDSLKDNLKEIQGMDDVFVYTDACITDAPLNKEFFAKKHIWPVGLYVGSKDASSEMDRHFPQNIIRESIEELVEAMLIRNRRTVG